MVEVPLSNMTYIDVDRDNIDSEHICCAISDKKCAESYQAKKDWLKREFENGYRFLRLDERAKVFIEYGPAESGWAPILAPNYLLINCFWVSGKYKKQGHGKALLKQVEKEAKKQGKDGLVTIVGAKKFHFMSDGKWLLGQGFDVCAELDSGFVLLVKKLNTNAENPVFNKFAKAGTVDFEEKGLVAYYSNRCPYAEYHVNTSLIETAKKRKIPLQTIKIETAKQAQSAPSPATIFSLFYDGKFVTTDISACMDSRFDKAMKAVLA